MSKQNHEVFICIPYSNYDLKEFEIEYNLNIIMLKVKDEPKILNKKNIFISKIKFLMSYLFQYPKIKYIDSIYRTLNCLVGFDLLISIAAPHSIHWGVSKAIKRNKSIAKKWIADCGDPFMGSKVDMFANPFWFKRLEKDFCRNCDFITIPIKSAIQGYYPEFHSKIKIIPQGFKLDKIYSKTKVNNIPTFAYSGSFYRGNRDPRPFLDLLVEIDIDFLFIMYTPSWHELNIYKEKLGKKLEIREMVDRDSLLEVLVQMDFLVNFENSTIVQSPSKLIDYCIVKRPILNISMNPSIELILEFLNSNYENRLPALDLSKYDITNVAKQFTSLVEK
ncbi:MAG: glycosyltransferase family 4 protein [Crenarchaeota archaeon]|nr:glycosyltransferase family 4 protein [Thermoproteota archaeon]